MKTRPTIIHLIRHGEVHNPQKILYGRLPGFRLTARGVEQARAAGRVLGRKPLDAVYSSPLLRARQTAREILAGHNPLKLRISLLINEVCGLYEGRPGAEIDALGGDVYTGAPACFEQPVEVVARTRRFISRIRRRHAGGRVAAVTHGDVITFMVLWTNDFELIPANKNNLLKTGFPVAYPVHASITTLTYRTRDGEERPSVDFLRP